MARVEHARLAACQAVSQVLARLGVVPSGAGRAGQTEESAVIPGFSVSPSEGPTTQGNRIRPMKVVEI
jgi:hypothetical protein